MSREELLDVFDDNFTHIGTATRTQVHEKGLWHQSFHCWLIQRVEDGGYVLFQRRGPDKKVYPNTLDISAAGHLEAGEKPADGVRELSEELGIFADHGDLIPLGIRCDVAIIGSVTNREFCHVYLLESDQPLDQFRLQKDEVAGLVRMSLSDCFRLFSNEAACVPVNGFAVDAQGERHEVMIEVGRKDIIPRLDNYYLKVAIMADRHFKGISYLAI